MATITNSRPSGIGALARATGVKAETIRYYESVGLLPNPSRSAGGHRLYEEEHAKRLRFIRRARGLGFGIPEISSLLSLGLRDARSCAEARNIATARLADVRVKMTHLAELETVLSKTIAECDTRCCTTDIPACPILQTLAS